MVTLLAVLLCSDATDEAFLKQRIKELSQAYEHAAARHSPKAERTRIAVLRELASLVGQGLATPEACDTILKKGYASRLPAMGAFEHADLAGLDLMNSDALKAVWADLSNVTDPAETPLGQLYAQGHTGMRSGQGFYDWTERDPEAFKAQRDEETVQHGRHPIARARPPRCDRSHNSTPRRSRGRLPPPYR